MSHTPILRIYLHGNMLDTSRAGTFNFMNVLKAAVEGAGGIWRLVYLKADEALLRERLAARRERFDANAAVPIGEAALARFLASFETPRGEGETTVRVA